MEQAKEGKRDMGNPARWMLLRFAVLIIAIRAAPLTAFAQNCTEIKDDMERLACYDRAAKSPNAAPSAVKTPARLDDFRIRPGQLFAVGALQLDFVGKVSNNANARLIGYICVRLYDADEFEIAHGFGREINLGLNQSDTSTGNLLLQDHRVWPQVRSIKAYVARWGCDQTLSQVVETKPSSR
jgi:hypothetical protein